jgi:succinoglycan biosynthesis transport protein ExoP
MDYLRHPSQEENYQLPPPPGLPYGPPPEEKEVNLRDYWKVIQKRGWTIIAFFLIVLIVTAIGTFTMKPVYRSTTTIQINKENPQILDFKEIFSVESWDTDYYQTQYKLLESRSLARKVIQQLKLSEHPEFVGRPSTPLQEWKSEVKKWASGLFASFNEKKSEPPKDPTNEDSSDSVKDAKDTPLVSQFLGRLQIDPLRNSRIVKIHFDSYDPELAAKVSNALATAYIQQNLESRFNMTQQAKEWLAGQLEEMKAKVERADEALEAFGSKHDIISLDEKDKGNITMGRLSELNDALAKAEHERMGKEVFYKQVRDKGYINSLPSISENKLISELKQSYIQLEVQYGKLSETFKPDYPEMVRIKKQMALIQKRMDTEGTSIIDKEVQRTIEAARIDYESSLRKESLLRAAFEQQKAKALVMKESAIRYNILKRESDTNKDLYKSLLQRMKETGVSAAMTASNIQVVDLAELPTAPYKPNKQLNLLLAAVVGLFLGVGLAFFFEYLDNTVKTPEDVEQLIRLPSFGMIPEMSSERKRRIEYGNSYPVELITFGHPKSMLSEAYRNVRTSVLLSFSERPPKMILITSPNPAEGKTTTAINTAIALSQTGAQVLIIDADLRHPRIHKIFPEANGVGLSTFLSGNVALESTIKKSEVPNLFFIPGGPIPPNPSELIGSNRFKSMMGSLGDKFDHIVVDSPPALGFSDSIILSAAVDGVILVVAGGKTARETLQRAKEVLRQVNAKILGVVINRVDLHRSGYGYYYYRYPYYYSHGEKKKKQEKELPYKEETAST